MNKGKKKIYEYYLYFIELRPISEKKKGYFIKLTTE